MPLLVQWPQALPTGDVDLLLTTYYLLLTTYYLLLTTYYYY